MKPAPYISHELDAVDYAIMFGDEPYGWQQRVMRDIWNGDPTALLTCNASGKTSLVLSNVGLAIMAHYPGARIVSTSGSWMQIETQLWPALRDKVVGMKGWEWNKREVKGPVTLVDGVPLQSSWVPFSTDDPNRAEGHHNRTVTGRTGQKILLPVAYFIDEAKGVSDGIFDAQSRCRLSFKAIMSSAGEDIGAGEDHVGNFYDAFHRNSSLWKRHVVDWTMCDHLSKDPKIRAQIEAEIRTAIKGRENPLIKSKYYAEFFRHAGYFVFDGQDMQKAMSGLVAKTGYDRCGAFDWSAGGDEQVWGVREGNKLEDMKIWHEKDDTKLATILLREINHWKLAGTELVFDAGGGGKSIVDILESRGVKGIRRYTNNEPASNGSEYANIYTEHCFERLAYHLRGIILPRDEVLERQMKARQYVMPNDDSNRKRLEPKEKIRQRGAESPDRLDMVIMAFSTWRPKEFDRDTAFAKKKHFGPCPDTHECFKPEDEDEEATGSLSGGWRGAE